MKCVTIHLSLHNEVLERGELSPAGTGQRGHGHHSGDQEGGWQHKNMLSRSSTYLQAIKCIYYPPINFRTENQDLKFLLVMFSPARNVSNRSRANSLFSLLCSKKA